MDLDFHKLTIDDKAIFDKYYREGECRISWNYSFTMMYIWDAFDETMVCDLGDMALGFTKFFGNTVFFPPFVKEPQLTPKALKIIESYCIKENIPMQIEGICSSDAEYIDKNVYESTTNRDNSDYIYDTGDLINLEGKKYHSKRNFITRFTSKYEYEFFDYTDGDFTDVLALYDKWYTKSVHQVLDLEKTVITRALKFHAELGLNIGLLKSGGTLIGFSVCSKENSLVGHVIFEKGDTSYDGVYQIINKLAAERYLSGCKYINRHEDMGIEGLRKAKLSYYPVLILDKYDVKKYN